MSGWAIAGSVFAAKYLLFAGIAFKRQWWRSVGLCLGAAALFLILGFTHV